MSMTDEGADYEEDEAYSYEDEDEDDEEEEYEGKKPFYHFYQLHIIHLIHGSKYIFIQLFTEDDEDGNAGLAALADDDKDDYAHSSNE